MRLSAGSETASAPSAVMSMANVTAKGRFRR